jgi:hypothetical protein
MINMLTKNKSYYSIKSVSHEWVKGKRSEEPSEVNRVGLSTAEEGQQPVCWLLTFFCC